MFNGVPKVIYQSLQFYDLDASVLFQKIGVTDPVPEDVHNRFSND